MNIEDYVRRKEDIKNNIHPINGTMCNDDEYFIACKELNELTAFSCLICKDIECPAHEDQHRYGW